MLDKELRNKCIDLLRDLAGPEYNDRGSRAYAYLEENPIIPTKDYMLTRSARDYLLSKGCLMLREPDRDGYVITAAGRDYLEELTTPVPWYWFKKNWFPAIVALATILFGGAAAFASVWNALTSCS